ncbi:hypothetical protein [Tranquillimonas alkanivorans]|uniref:Lipoprotein n=1 Tax=Tranquillimonas alkanivorans TaxID=441119 RepID=A0A1I5RDC6_9RHOB|nr:hypothetical protein [Tranquillimonas alkanivorans]SFP56533.1 hypothetical protein SAMN04488047_108120 [Tranquillimonas alkanivorans]
MGRGLLTAIVIVGTAAGCARVADSRLNPFTWFGGSSEVAVTEEAAVTDGRPLMDRVVALTVDPTPGGAVVQATGLPPQQGYWNGELIPSPADVPGDTVAEYQFRVAPPFEPTRVSTPQSREVVVGTYLTQEQLAGIREIRVVGAGNALAVRR